MQLLGGWQGVDIELGVHDVKFFEHFLKNVLLSLVTNRFLSLVYGFVAEGGLVALGDAHSVLVGRQFE